MNVRSILFAVALIATPVAASGQDAMTEHQAAMDTMMSSMHGMKSMGNPDMDFSMMMIPHHQSAIDMAKVQLKYGKDPEMRALAEKIIADQEREIAEMKALLAERK